MKNFSSFFIDLFRQAFLKKFSKFLKISIYVI